MIDENLFSFFVANDFYNKIYKEVLEEFENYKANRKPCPEELKTQFPISRDLLTALGIVHYEVHGYEADDIIGTLAKKYNIETCILSSDRDLLQLISDVVDVKLLKQKDYVMMNTTTFKEEYGLDPIKIIDIVTPTIKYLKNSNPNKIGIIATQNTRNSKIFLTVF